MTAKQVELRFSWNEIDAQLQQGRVRNFPTRYYDAVRILVRKKAIAEVASIGQTPIPVDGREAFDFANEWIGAMNADWQVLYHVGQLGSQIGIGERTITEEAVAGHDVILSACRIEYDLHRLPGHRRYASNGSLEEFFRRPDCARYPKDEERSKLLEQARLRTGYELFVLPQDESGPELAIVTLPGQGPGKLDADAALDFCLSGREVVRSISFADRLLARAGFADIDNGERVYFYKDGFFGNAICFVEGIDWEQFVQNLQRSSRKDPQFCSAQFSRLGYEAREPTRRQHGGED